MSLFGLEEVTFYVKMSPRNHYEFYNISGLHLKIHFVEYQSFLFILLHIATLLHNGFASKKAKCNKPQPVL